MWYMNSWWIFIENIFGIFWIVTFPISNSRLRAYKNGHLNNVPKVFCVTILFAIFGYGNMLRSRLIFIKIMSDMSLLLSCKRIESCSQNCYIIYWKYTIHSYNFNDETIGNLLVPFAFNSWSFCNVGSIFRCYQTMPTHACFIITT